MSHARTGSRPWSKWSALVLSLCLLVSLAPGARSEAPEPKPAHSTYQLTTTLPSEASAATAVDFSATLRTADEAEATYGKAFYQVRTDGPGSVTYHFSREGQTIDLVNAGDWQENGFQVAPQMTDALSVQATFTLPGLYQVTLTVGTPDKRTIAEVTQAVTVMPYQLVPDLPSTAAVGTFAASAATVLSGVPAVAGPARLVAEKLAGPGDLLLTTPFGGAVTSYLNRAELAIQPAAATAVPLNLKFAKAGTYTVRLSVLDGAGQALATPVERQVTVDPSFQNLGPQVTSQLAMRGVFGMKNGRTVTYTVLAGTPAIFVVADVETEKTIESYEIPDTSGAWGLTVASDGKVYFATYNVAHIFQYDPATSVITDLGDPAQLIGLQNTTQYFELTAGPNGRIYGGGYPNGNVFEYDPQTGFRNFGQIVPGTQYPRSVAYDPEANALWVGGGAPKAWLVKVDLATGEKSGNLLPQADSDKATYTYDLNWIDGKLFLKMDPTYGLVVIDTKTMQVLKDLPATATIHSRGVSPKSPYENKVYLTYAFILKTLDLDTMEIADVKSGATSLNVGGSIIGAEWVQLHDPDFPGLSLVAWSGNNAGLFFKYNPTTGALRMVNLDIPRTVSTLHNLAVGPDGKLYAGAYLGGGMGIMDPFTLKSASYSFGQPEGITSLGRKLYFGVYPGANIFEYDTAKAWKSSGSNRTVVSKFSLKPTYEQDRPYAMLGVPELGKVLIGTVPDYGKRGGALTIYDPATGVYDVYRNVVDGHSVVSLAYKNGVIYGGTTYRGGLGAEDVYGDARIFAFDPVTRQKLWEVAPFPGLGGITSLIVGPDGNLWGWAMGEFFVFDPATRQVIHSEMVYPDAVSVARDAHMAISVFDGNVYGTVAGRFFKIESSTLAVTTLRSEQARNLAQDSRGNFYFSDGVTTDGPNLWRLAFDDARVPVTGVSIPAGAVTLAVGATKQLSADIQPSFATWKDVTWATSNASVASVDAKGLVTAVRSGTALITVTTADGQFQAAIQVTVQ